MDFADYRSCRLCPRECGANRLQGETGYCHCTAELQISAICVHTGEEPVINGKQGICNVFFSHCNLQCIYCQNRQISDNRREVPSRYPQLAQAVDAIAHSLDQGVHAVGFVSPAPFLPHVKAIIEDLHQRGYSPVTVYNSNGYDRPEELQKLEGLIDIYLPDLKYMDAGLARDWSDAADYPEKAKLALQEMYRQKGTTLRMRDELTAESGLIVRHLVMPGQADDSIRLLEWLADACSPRLHLSLMSQYTPLPAVQHHPLLGRSLNESEYRRVVTAAEQAGFTRGWTQEFSSRHFYVPNFDCERPFGE